MKKPFFGILSASFLLFAVLLGSKGCESFERARETRLREEARTASWQRLRERVKDELRQFKGDAGIVLKDLRSGRELSYQKDKLFASASLVKVPIMAAVLQAAEEGRVDLKREIPLRRADKLSGSGFLKQLPEGTAMSVWRLVGLMIYESDNTATHLVTNLLGLEALNRDFENFGLTQTRLSRKVADYRARDRGVENYTSAGEMAMLLEKIYLRTLGSPSVSEQCIGILKLTRLNDRIPKHLPAELTIAHKTGLENGVCHDAGIVFTPQGDLVVAVLTRHDNPDSDLSKEFIAKVARHAYDYLQEASAAGSKPAELPNPQKTDGGS